MLSLIAWCQDGVLEQVMASLREWEEIGGAGDRCLSWRTAAPIATEPVVCQPPILHDDDHLVAAASLAANPVAALHPRSELALSAALQIVAAAPGSRTLSELDGVHCNSLAALQ